MGAQLQQPGKRGGRHRARTRPMSEINVTPFVDVMLVLLIIFMVAAPLLTVGVEMDLPRTSASPLPTEQEEPLTINIDAEQRVYIQRTEVDAATLVPKLQAIASERQSRKVFLRADATVPHGRVQTIIASLMAGGFTELAFIHDKVEGH
ncbi:MAG: biopolymer transporter ExbD [Pseudomonadota bacterium]